MATNNNIIAAVQYAILGDNISTDEILHARYAMLADDKEKAKYIFADLGSEISHKCQTSTIIIAGKNFGCGSGRESSVVAMKASGIKVVIADSFARIFYRNAINQGLLVIECPGISDFAKGSIKLSINIEKSTIYSDSGELEFNPLPQFLTEILSSGSLVEFGRKIIERKRGEN